MTFSDPFHLVYVSVLPFMLLSAWTDINDRVIWNEVHFAIIIIGLVSFFQGIHVIDNILFTAFLYLTVRIAPNRLGDYFGGGDLKLMISTAMVLDFSMWLLWMILSMGFAILHNLFNRTIRKINAVEMGLDFLLAYLVIGLLILL